MMSGGNHVARMREEINAYKDLKGTLEWKIRLEDLDIGKGKGGHVLN
jgi:hypothetical protein